MPPRINAGRFSMDVWYKYKGIERTRNILKYLPRLSRRILQKAEDLSTQYSICMVGRTV